MPEADGPSRLLAGQIGKPHGLAGEVYVVPISDDPHRFDPGSELLTESDDPLVVESARRHRNRLLVKFAGVDNRDAAELLRGPLYVTPESLRPLGEDEYWEHELIDCRVVVAGSGEDTGKVARVEHGAAQDLLVVETPRGERLVPIVKQFVVEIDIAGRKVLIDPPEGLLE